jgi:hypothetical protein
MYYKYSLENSEIDSIRLIVTHVDSVECEIMRHKRVTLSYQFPNEYDTTWRLFWIEGVGTPATPFYSLLSNLSPDSRITQLVSFKIKGILKYQNSNTDSLFGNGLKHK